MGLDNIWTDADPEPVFDPELRLCGGMFSAHGQGSFRGKVYADLLYKTLGVDLYKNLDNAEVRRIADLLEGVDEEHWSLEYTEDWAWSGAALKDFRRMFRAYADAGARLVAWY